MDSQDKTYLDWIDIAKGIGIILVVVGHSFRDGMRAENYACEFIYQFIYFFHMPLFFAISGITFYISYKKYLGRKNEFYKKKFKTLFIPMLTYSLIIYIIFGIVNLIPQLHSMLQSASYPEVNIVDYIIKNLAAENPYASHLWFIWVLFLISIFIFFVYSKIKTESVLLPVAIMLLAFLVRMVLDRPVLVVHYFLYDIIFFCVGIIIGQKRELLLKSNWIVKLLSKCSLLFLIFSIFNKILFNKTTTVNFFEELIYIIVKCLIIISIVRLSALIKRNCFLEKLGKASFAVYLLHQPFCCGFVGIALYNILGFPILLVCVVCVCLSFFLPYLFIWIIKKNRITAKAGKILLNI